MQSRVFLLPVRCRLLYLLYSLALLSTSSINADVITQVGEVEWLQHDLQDYMEHSFTGRFGTDFPSIGAFYLSELTFQKFDSKLGTLTNVALNIRTEVTLDHTLAPVGVVQPNGSPYPEFGDLGTESKRRMDITTWVSTRRNGASPFNRLLSYNINTVDAIVGIPLNTVPVRMLLETDEHWEFPLTSVQNIRDSGLINFTKSSADDVYFDHIMGGSTNWQIDAYYLHPGQAASPETYIGYPPWNILQFRNAGEANMQMKTTVSYSFEYTAAAVPEPSGIAICLISILTAGHSARRRCIHNRNA